MTRWAEKDQPEFAGWIPRREPKKFGFPAVKVPSVSSILSVYDMRATKTSYCHPSRVSGRQFDSVTEGIVGASVLISIALSVIGDHQWSRKPRSSCATSHPRLT